MAGIKYVTFYCECIYGWEDVVDLGGGSLVVRGSLPRGLVPIVREYGSFCSHSTDFGRWIGQTIGHTR